MGGDLDRVDECLRQPGGRHVFPCRATVPCELHQAVVTAGPDHALFVWRLHHVGEGAVVLGANGFVGERSAAFALCGLVVAREVGRDLLPRFAEVARLQQHLRTVVEGVWFVATPDDRSVPVVAVFHVLRVHPEVLDGSRHDVGAARSRGVEHFNRALVTAAEHQRGFVRVKGKEGALATGRRPPRIGRDAAATQFAAGDRERRVVLLSGVDTIRKLVVHVDAIQLRRGHVVLRTPALALVERDRGAAVVGENVVGRIGGIDPHVVEVAVRRIDR